GRTEFTQHKVAAILKDFLQPDSKTSLESAAKSLLVLIPTNASEHAEVCSFGEICVELAEQIPYHHPSQLKLVQLLHYLSRSPKFMYKYERPPQEEAQGAFQLLWESIVDWASGPDEENHNAWVNINAFKANLFATGVWGTSPGQSLKTLCDAFETKKPEEAWERDCKVMAAAQWILWHGQTLFKLIIYDHLEEPPGEGSNWGFGNELEGSKMPPRSVERWRFWKAGFEAVEQRALNGWNNNSIACISCLLGMTLMQRIESLERLVRSVYSDNMFDFRGKPYRLRALRRPDRPLSLQVRRVRL
ncbi:hypothetical protein QBC33DRAFT_461266, partial [Phialemonium atrogriseum]